jgi:mRNA interferase HigB
VHIITRTRLKEFWEKHPEAETSLRAWFKNAKQGWANLDDLHKQYPSADYVSPYTIFDIGHNKFRLITVIEYKLQKVFIQRVLTHAEYDRWNRKRDTE